ncbi:HD domain-containing phosphohydrolase [Treponema sp.]|uniref:HD domain-containing phosphohydrolase n=1 Tax=Treponema sp. TaxID=166 RepID=UPI00388D6454
MFILLQNLLIFAFLFSAFLTFVFLYVMFFRRNVLARKDIFRLISTTAAVIMLFALSALIIVVYSSYLLTVKYGAAILILTFVILVAFTWFISYLHGVEKTSMQVLQAIVGVIEAGDPNLEGHSLHVQRLTMLMYDYLPLRYRLSLNPYNLEYAALLFDVGKLGVPRSIIQKIGKLEQSEWEFMRRHPGIGVKILKPIPSFVEILNWIKYHHERVDGTGYYHLEGNEIPLASRVIAIADTYSAITMERSYKATLSYEEAVSELKLASGTQLDPELVEVFCSIPLHKVDSCMKEVIKIMKCYDEENFRN